MTGILRVIGDVHAQIDEENLVRTGATPYLDIIAGVTHSLQVGDMGDEETYCTLVEKVDPMRHRFLRGNHEQHTQLPPHVLGDFGIMNLNGVEFFFVRGAASTDREKLIELGRRVRKTLWFPEEELTDAEMSAAREAYRQAAPRIMITHEAPNDIANLLRKEAALKRHAVMGGVLATRTKKFLQELLEIHAPQLWIFGHHHYDWAYRERETRFICVGELSYVDVNPEGGIIGAIRK